MSADENERWAMVNCSYQNYTYNTIITLTKHDIKLKLNKEQK